MKRLEELPLAIVITVRADLNLMKAGVDAEVLSAQHQTTVNSLPGVKVELQRTQPNDTD